MRCLFSLRQSPREHLEFPNLYDVDNKKRKSSSCPFAGAKKAPKRKQSSKRLSKDRAKDLAASDKGSYFEQEQLLALTTKEKDESQDD